MVGGWKTAVAADEIVRVFVARFGTEWAVWATVSTHVSDQVEHNVRMSEGYPDELSANEAMVRVLSGAGFVLASPVVGLDSVESGFTPAS